MREIREVVETSWPNIRVVLYQRDDGLYQIVEEHLTNDGKGDTAWLEIDTSGIYDDIEIARADMIPFAENIEAT